MLTEKKEPIFSMGKEKDAIEHLRKNQGTTPFRCPHLIIVHERMKHGSTMFEKGDILCTSGFLDICCLFSRVKADEEGNIVTRCRKDNEGLEVRFRRDESTN